MLKKVLLFVTLFCIANITTAADSIKFSEQAQITAESDAYQAYLTQTQQIINDKFPTFFADLKQNEQLIWIDYVGKQGEKYGYDNVSLRQGFAILSCYLGKDFMNDKDVEAGIKKFLQDDKFSKYVRIRDMQRYLKREKYQLTSPSVNGIK